MVFVDSWPESWVMTSIGYESAWNIPHQTLYITKNSSSINFKSRLVYMFRHMFSVFKQHYTYFYTLFHSHVFSKIQTTLLEQRYQKTPKKLDFCKLEF